MKTYIVIWHHRFGNDVELVRADHWPSEEEVADALDWDYEPNRGETMDISIVELDKIVDIK
jgi:hypothetical protein